MAKKPDQETIDTIQRDAAAGMNINAIAEKNGVGWATAAKYSAQGGGQTDCQSQNKIEWPRQWRLQHELDAGAGRRDLGYVADRQEGRFAAAVGISQ